MSRARDPCGTAHQNHGVLFGKCKTRTPAPAHRLSLSWGLHSPAGLLGCTLQSTSCADEPQVQEENLQASFMRILKAGGPVFLFKASLLSQGMPSSISKNETGRYFISPDHRNVQELHAGKGSSP